MDAVRPTVSTITTGSGRPASNSSAATAFATPTRKGIDRSMPPIADDQRLAHRGEPHECREPGLTVRAVLAKPGMGEKEPMMNRPMPSSSGSAMEPWKRARRARGHRRRATTALNRTAARAPRDTIWMTNVDQFVLVMRELERGGSPLRPWPRR